MTIRLNEHLRTEGLSVDMSLTAFELDFLATCVEEHHRKGGSRNSTVGTLLSRLKHHRDEAVRKLRTPRPFECRVKHD